MRDITVGFESHNYGGARNSYAPVAGVKYVKLRRAPLELVPGKESRGFHRVFVPIPPNPRVDLVHLWNRVSVGRTPWGVSFESTLPYLNPALHERMIALQTKRLRSDNCRFIIAISDHARTQLKKTLPDKDWAAIQHKVSTVFPDHRQEPRRSNFPELLDSEPLRLLFVGVTFFGKGGEAVLRTVERLGSELNLELTVISPVAGGDYGGTPPADVDVTEIHRRLDENPRIQWIRSLPNIEVLAEIEKHHIGLLPTLADTFGYVAIEYMALGLPSVVSNVQALPEFTGSGTGWTVHVEVDDGGVWIGRQSGIESRRNRYVDAIDELDAQLCSLLQHFRSNPSTLAEMSQSATAHYRTAFDVEQRALRVRRLYEEAIA